MRFSVRDDASTRLVRAAPSMAQPRHERRWTLIGLILQPSAPSDRCRGCATCPRPGCEHERKVTLRRVELRVVHARASRVLSRRGSLACKREIREKEGGSREGCILASVASPVTLGPRPPPPPPPIPPPPPPPPPSPPMDLPPLPFFPYLSLKSGEIIVRKLRMFGEEERRRADARERGEGEEGSGGSARAPEGRPSRTAPSESATRGSRGATHARKVGAADGSGDVA